MALDPRIILGIRPTPNMGPDFGQAIADGNGLLRLQQQQEQMKQMAEMKAAADAAVGGGPEAGNALTRLVALNPQMAGQIQQFQQQNALRGILGQPGAVDANGQPTDETMQKVMSVDPATGMADVPELPAFLFPHQRAIAAWALRRGRSAIFAGTGLGKTATSIFG